MQISLKDLPLEVDTLHQIISGLQSQNTELKEKCNILSNKNHELSEELKSLREQLCLLKSKRFGKSSEKLERKIAEVESAIEEKESLLGFTTNKKVNLDTKSLPSKKAKRKKLPEYLPREEVILEAEKKCSCCGGENFRKIGEDVSEVLEHIPESLKVIRYVRPRSACTNCKSLDLI